MRAIDKRRAKAHDHQPREDGVTYVWFAGPPPHVGWWNASYSIAREIWRWWDGSAWSVTVLAGATPETAARRAEKVDNVLPKNQPVLWTTYYPKDARVPRVDPRVTQEQQSNGIAILPLTTRERTHLEVSRDLALALGWREVPKNSPVSGGEMYISYTNDMVWLWHGGRWRNFDCRAATTILPLIRHYKIALHFMMVTSTTGLWVAKIGNHTQVEFELDKAVALAVINTQGKS